MHEQRIDVITCVIDQKDSHSRPLSLEIDVGPADTTTKRISGWIKTTMEWYFDGVILENEMILTLQYLVNIGVIKLE